MDMLGERFCAAASHVASLGYTPVYVSLHGSQNYGLAIHTAEYQSDYDFKCIVLPSLWDLAEGKKPASLTVDMQDGQMDIKDIRVFMDSVVKMNPSYLESLATDHAWMFGHQAEMERIRGLVPELLKQRGTAFARVCEGLFEEKERRMCHLSPSVKEKIERFGYDGKQAHHMYRLLVMLRGFEESGEMRLCAPENERALLTDLKLNRYGLEDVQDKIVQWKREIQALRMSIERRYGEPKDETAREMIHLSRAMIVAHCRRDKHEV
ncbi:MAG: hypothetical protein E7321_08960 [Clostridiales bacterium]|nr:hypothetical protein [Clostridiales bacterium]